MYRSNYSPRRTIPPWVLLVVAVAGVIVVGYFGWRAISGYESEVGPPKKVYPHMYDLQAEIAKKNGAQQTGGTQHGP